MWRKMNLPKRRSKALLRKTLALCLAVILFACALPLSVLASEENKPITFAVGTDIHIENTATALSVNYPESALYFHASGSGNLYDQAAALTRDFLRRSADEGAEFILIAGDLTRSGNEEQHQYVASLLADFEAETGIQVYVVPGNHDYYNSDPAHFKRYYAAFGYDAALAATESSASYTADVGDRYRLIAVDSNDPGNDGDGITDALLQWIKAQAEQARKDGKEILYMMHHPLLEHLYQGKVLMKDFIVRNSEAIAEQFSNWGIQYVFSGHEHGNDIASYTGKNGAVVYDVLTTSLSSYPLEYRMVTLSDAGAALRMRKLETCDLDALVEGYTDAQKALLAQDYEAFAYGYFRYAIEKKILRYITPAFIKEKLKLNSGPLADTVDALFAAVNDALTMPLYETDERASIESLAKSKGVTIPASDYDSLISLATAMVAMHYYGDENVPAGSSPECEILVKGLNTGLQYILTRTGRDGLNTLLNLMGTQINTEELSPLFRAVTLGREDSYLIAEQVLYPILDRFAVDFSWPDRDVVLPAQPGNPPAESNPAQAFLKRIFAYLQQLIRQWLAALNRIPV